MHHPTRHRQKFIDRSRGVGGISSLREEFFRLADFDGNLNLTKREMMSGLAKYDIALNPRELVMKSLVCLV